MTDEWTPEKEEEDDPAKLAKEQLALGKKFLKKMEDAEAEEERRRQQYASSPVVGAPSYTPPTFEEVSEAIKKSWEEVEKIVPSAPDMVKLWCLQTMINATAQRRGYM